MARMKTVIVIGTVDTKGPELAYLKEQVIAAGCLALLMDVGVHNQSETAADITAGEVARSIGEDIETLRALPRGEAVEKISNAVAVPLSQLVLEDKSHGVIGLGGFCQNFHRLCPQRGNPGRSTTDAHQCQPKGTGKSCTWGTYPAGVA
jgi:uncharacterized protein (UPF0261 family)